MADAYNDNDRRETVVVKERRRSKLPWIILLLLLLAIGAYFVFGAANDDETDTRIDTPNSINTPDSINVPDVDTPDVDVDVNRQEDGNTTAP